MGDGPARWLPEGGGIVPKMLKFTVDDSKLVKLMNDLKAQGKPVRIIADGVEYGLFVHEGYTSRGGNYIAGRPFLGDAIETHRKEIGAAIKKAGPGNIEAAIETAARKVEYTTKANINRMHAVDTGALLNSIHVVDPGGSFSFEVPGK